MKLIKKILSGVISLIFTLISLILIYYIDQRLQLSFTTKLIYVAFVILFIYLYSKHLKSNEDVLYIKVYKNKLIIRHILKKLETEQLLTETFTSAVNLIEEQYNKIETQLKEGVDRHFKHKWYLPRPVVLIHAMGTQVEELSKEESDLFKELAFSVGARKVFVVTGPELSDEFLYESSKET